MEEGGPGLGRQEGEAPQGGGGGILHPERKKKETYLCHRTKCPSRGAGPNDVLEVEGPSSSLEGKAKVRVWYLILAASNRQRRGLSRGGLRQTGWESVGELSTLSSRSCVMMAGKPVRGGTEARMSSRVEHSLRNRRIFLGLDRRYRQIRRSCQSASGVQPVSC